MELASHVLPLQAPYDHRADLLLAAGPFAALFSLPPSFGCLDVCGRKCFICTLLSAAFSCRPFSSVLFACALATSKPSEKQTPKQQRKLRLQQQPVTALPHADFPALEAAASAAAPTADTTAAYQRERPEQQQPPEAGMDEGSQDTNCSWPANETTALLHDFVRHNRSNSSSSSKGKYLECVTEGLKVQSGVFQQFEVHVALPIPRASSSASLRVATSRCNGINASRMKAATAGKPAAENADAPAKTAAVHAAATAAAAAARKCSSRNVEEISANLADGCS
ncbi:hypothetical protein, conserved [Eimeria acervulina]|uniref:Uncharacterized protein n=1 Tax=Eimeria acervulina TaxID=5801 RepID=U6GN63_EIMAC|nr:hypothetical protein, conserved [Eimeria acervulina]CDI80034.1 hypothetical protein, conserved [Eimeria acervulina]